MSYKKFKGRLTQELVVILRPYYKAKLFKSDVCKCMLELQLMLNYDIMEHSTLYKSIIFKE